MGSSSSADNLFKFVNNLAPIIGNINRVASLRKQELYIPDYFGFFVIFL